MNALILGAILFAASATAPSRSAEKGCKWERLEDHNAGLAAWVQRCDYGGGRKSDFFFKGKSLMSRYSDGGTDPVIDVIDLLPNETAEEGLKRFFAAHTDKKIAARCLLQAYKGDTPPPKGVRRFTFVADAKLQKEIDKKTPKGDIPDPACGDYGDQPDSIQYFEAHDGARRLLFVRIGQDIPMFDEETLRILK